MTIDETRLMASIRQALEDRDPAPMSPVLAERVERIPDEVPIPSSFLARTITAAVVAAGVAAVLAVFLLGSDRWSHIVGQTGQEGEPGGTIDLRQPAGGLAEVGLFGLPWIVFIPVGIALVASVATSVRRTALDPNGSFRDWFRRRQTPPTRRERMVNLAIAVTIPTVFWLLTAASDFDPLVSGSVYGPGPSVTEIRADGTTIPEDLDNPNPDDWDFASDRYVYRRSPGDTFTYMTSVRNSGPVAIRLLGLTAPVAGARTTDAPLGMFLLQDPTVLSLEPHRLVEFVSMDLQPGSEVTLVIVSAAGPCANPEGTVWSAPSSPDMIVSARGLSFVYELFGWRHAVPVWPRFEVTVPGLEPC